ncbi:MAG: hypothetical protein E2P00_07100 [Acidobacteria bacterium]|nr:MAG: hypothetical protein E2P03_07940 [Acidobacteriota bacterium]TDI41558.1 MAG: hypothetical protein E2P00_07100 [Acidobacteriota bacterium]
MARIPPKPEPAVLLHENVTLMEMDRPGQMEELQALPAFRAALVKILDPCTVVLDGRRLPELMASLRKHGHNPRVLSEENGE